MAENLSLEAVIQKLNSDDPTERRQAVFDLNNEEINDEVIKILCDKLLDPDKGVSDAVSEFLIFNKHHKIPQFIVPYITSADLPKRNLAGEVLLKKGEDSVDALINYIPKGNDDDKKFIIDILGLIRDGRSLPDIKEVLHDSRNDNVILACLEAIGNIADPEYLEDLITFYDKNELFKPTIIEAIGKIGSKEALDFITKRYPLEDELTKFSIIETYGQIGDEGTFFDLLGEIKKIKGPLIWPIVEALRSLRDRLGLDIPYDENMKNSILFTILEGDTKYKQAASSLITLFNDKDIILASLKIYGEDYEIDDNIKPKFLENSATTLPRVAEIIRHQPPNTKNILELVQEMIFFDEGAALNSMSALDRRSLSDSLVVCIENPDEEVRAVTIDLLFRIDFEAAFIFADNMLADDNVWNRLKLVEILESVNDPRTNEILIKLASDPEEMISERVGWILNQRGLKQE